MSFANKVVIVTGASSGIGAATAVLFAEQGADVAIVARRQPKLEEVAKTADRLNREKRVEVTALGYMATNEEVGGVILFLASDKAKSVTGSNYVIDNAYTIK